MKVDEYLSLVGKFKDEILALDKKRHIIREGSHDIEIYIEGQAIAGNTNMIGQLLWEITNVYDQIDKESIKQLIEEAQQQQQQKENND